MGLARYAARPRPAPGHGAYFAWQDAQLAYRQQRHPNQTHAQLIDDLRRQRLLVAFAFEALLEEEISQPPIEPGTPQRLLQYEAGRALLRARLAGDLEAELRLVRARYPVIPQGPGLDAFQLARSYENVAMQAFNQLDIAYFQDHTDHMLTLRFRPPRWILRDHPVPPLW